MTSSVLILPALVFDLPQIVALRVEAAEEDILTRFLYGHRHIEASQKEAASLMISLGRRFTNPTNRCHIVKAIDTVSNELVGWGFVRWEDGQWMYSNLPPPSKDSANSNFISQYQKGVRQYWQKILAKKPHIVIGALNVKVDQQRRGVGKKVVEYFDAEHGMGSELVIVQTNSSAKDFYKKLGWETVDSTDVDLSEFVGKGKGYGVHRSPQMIRYPKKWQGTMFVCGLY